MTERKETSASDCYIRWRTEPGSTPPPTKLEGSCEKMDDEHYLLKLGCEEMIVHNAKEAGKALEKTFKEYFEKEKK
jgi:hypothetical protein